jgi:hypothetical protein
MLMVRYWGELNGRGEIRDFLAFMLVKMRRTRRLHILVPIFAVAGLESLPSIV